MVLRKLSQGFKITLALMLSVLSSGILQVAPAFADTMYEVPTNGKITICHSTQPNPSQGNGSGPQDNPYNVLTVSTEAADGIANENGNTVDHFSHDGDSAGVFVPDTDMDTWGDIIPPIPGAHEGLNWDVSGQLIYRNGCAVPEQTVTPTGALSVDVDCEEILLGSSAITPEDGTVTYTINGSEADEGSNVVEAGTYTVELLVNGTVVETRENVVVEACEGEVVDENQGICHATGSGKFVLITNIDSAGIFSGHYGSGRGDHQDGNDIIPPFTYQGKSYSQNWDARGQAIFEAGCETQRTPTVCTVTNNTYLDTWVYDEETYPLEEGGGSYEFKNDGLHINTPTIEASVYGLTSGGNTPLADVGAMSYQTMRKMNSAGYEYTAPAYILAVDTNGTETAGGLKYFFYEPYNNSPPLVQEGDWQTWDAMMDGEAKWWMSGTGQTLRTWDYFVSEYPDAVVLAYGFNQGTYNAETYSIVQNIMFDCATTKFGAPKVGGDTDTPVVTPVDTGGGQGSTHVLATSTVLPAMLPATGAKDSPFMIIAAAMIAYGATYFLQGRRKLLRNEA